MNCRFCGQPLKHEMCNLGTSPLANDYLRPEALALPETFYPLHALVCSACWLVQLAEYESPRRIFSDYAYFSSYSSSLLDHSRRYADRMVKELQLTPASQVIEIASNDGYLLQYFQEHEVGVLGVEPAENVAEAAKAKGIPTIARFFGRTLAEELVADRTPDLVVGNNVLAHVPDINDFVAGVGRLLTGQAVATFEFPHLLRLLEDRQFDTIYHEHFSYLSLSTVQRVFDAHGLRVTDVEELPTHGGSLRVHAMSQGSGRQPGDTVHELLGREENAGLLDIATYEGFAEQVQEDKRHILRFLIDQADAEVRLAGYGAPAKANTLFNYCGVGPELVPYTVDLSPHKQGCYMPGSRIPILAPEELDVRRPELIWILAWNLRDEIVQQLQHARSWGAQFVARTPDFEVLP